MIVIIELFKQPSSLNKGVDAPPPRGDLGSEDISRADVETRDGITQ